MSPEEFDAWFGAVRELHGWDRKTALTRLGASKNMGSLWTAPGGSGPPLYIALACSALARHRPLAPWKPPVMTGTAP